MIQLFSALISLALKLVGILTVAFFIYSESDPELSSDMIKEEASVEIREQVVSWKNYVTQKVIDPGLEYACNYSKSSEQSSE